MSVPHSHIYFSMTQKLLEIKDISAVHHIVRSKAVSQIVEANFIRDPCPCMGFMKASIHMRVFHFSSIPFHKDKFSVKPLFKRSKQQGPHFTRYGIILLSVVLVESLSPVLSLVRETVI